MTRLARILALGFLLIGALPATADELTIQTFDPESATEPLAGVEGPGIKVGERTVLHPTIGLAAGAISNVFYEENNTNGGGVLRLLAQIGVGSLSKQRLTPTDAESGEEPDLGMLQYRASLRAAYDLMFAGSDAVSDTGGLGIGGTGNLTINPSGRVSLGIDENFMRLIRSANFETGVNTNRDINVFGLNLTLHSPSTTLSGMAYYQNTIDVFERDEQSFADRFQHRFGVRPMWRFRPKTLFFADVSKGYYGGLGSDSTKVSSAPLTALAGVGTLFTPFITLNFQAGYTNGFYSSGPNYSSLLLGAQVGYRYAARGRATLSYDLRHEDSVNANFYRDHVIRLSAQHSISRFTAMVQPELHFRRYTGITEVMGAPQRDDVIFAIVAGVNYVFKDSLAATLDYRFTDVSTDYRYTTDGITDDPGYVRHQVMLGVRWAL